MKNGHLRRLRLRSLFARSLTVCLLFAGIASYDISHAFLRAAPATSPGEAGATEASPAAPRGKESGGENPARQQHQARQAVDRTELYDPANPDRARLQRIEEATRHLPYDANGFPDWMRALREHKITPRHDLDGKARPALLDLDIIMRNTKEMPAVRFPHLAHTMWLSCSNCHPAPFRAEKGSNPIRMSDIFRGQYCGMCHDRVAFVTFYSCTRCHSEPAGTNAASK